MAKELPEDLVTQILIWLPVVSLLRFKSVCKFWYALISHQNFIRKHLLHNKNSNTLILPKTSQDYIVSMLSYETLQVSLTQRLPPPHFGIDKKVWICVVGSCNGLVCLYDFYALRVVIWNPATKETKLVPKSNTSIEGFFGFGFDAKTNDYKIINVVNNFESNLMKSEKIVQSEVYSLSADSWRKVDSPLFVIIDRHLGPNKYINGVASWRVFAEDWEGLLSFDMSDEVFLKTHLPDDVLNESGYIFVLNGSIAMSVRIGDQDDIDEYLDAERSEICFDIWLLLKVGVKDSWTKLFTIGPFIEIGQPLGFWKNDNMFLEKDDGKLVLYDPATKQMTYLQIDWTWSYLVTYMETLVSIERGDVFEEQDRC